MEESISVVTSVLLETDLRDDHHISPVPASSLWLLFASELSFCLHWRPSVVDLKGLGWSGRAGAIFGGRLRTLLRNNHNLTKTHVSHACSDLFPLILLMCV